MSGDRPLLSFIFITEPYKAAGNYFPNIKDSGGTNPFTRINGVTRGWNKVKYHGY